MLLAFNFLPTLDLKLYCSPTQTHLNLPETNWAKELSFLAIRQAGLGSPKKIKHHVVDVG